MVYSMTGFGKATEIFQNKTITVEIRCLNSKQLDLSLRLPSLYREKENTIRQLVAAKIIRGKTDFSVYTECNTPEELKSINKEVFKQHYAELKKLAEELHADSSDVFAQTFKMPDIFKTSEETLCDEEWNLLQQIIDKAVNEVCVFRKQEGQSTENDLKQRINAIENCLKEIETFELERKSAILERLKQSLSDLLNDSSFDKARFEQELIYYLEKIDINEEKVRLKNHLTYFLEIISTEEEHGRKLGFIAQEMGREINTMGSKANHAGMQKVVVQMKDELEKIKEQVLNIL